jgi:hypothetical protein
VRAAKDYVGDGFRIEYRWKEEVVYWEGSRGFLFDAGWGVEPPVLYVPSPDVWQDVMPDWLRDRRGIVVQRLEQHSEHVLMDDVHGHYRLDPESRTQAEPSSE